MLTVWSNVKIAFRLTIIIAQILKDFANEMTIPMIEGAKDFKKNHPRLFWFAVVIAVLGVVIGIGFPAFGFTSAGIAAGSAATGIHAVIGNVAAGSLFATLQSMGALSIFSIVGGCVQAQASS